LSGAGDAPSTALGNKLAFQILTTRPSSSVARSREPAIDPRNHRGPRPPIAEAASNVIVLA
jgi:hypothetical protein